jgi:hypothetical protein
MDLRFSEAKETTLSITFTTYYYSNYLLGFYMFTIMILYSRLTIQG